MDWYYAQLLADYLGIDEKDVEQSDYNYNILIANVDGEEHEYYVGTYDEMKQLAIDSFCDLYDDIGEQLLNDRDVKPFLDYGWDDEALDSWFEWNEDWSREEINNCYDLADEFISLYGEDYKYAEMCGVWDVSEVADEVIEMYGIANELASYDGKEIELGKYDGEDIYAYRVN